MSFCGRAETRLGINSRYQRPVSLQAGFGWAMHISQTRNEWTSRTVRTGFSSAVKDHVQVAQYVRKCLNEALSIYWTSLTLTAAGKRFPLLSSPRGQWWNQNFHECKFQLQLILMTMTSLLYEVHNEPDHSLAKSHDKLQACPSGHQCFLYPWFKQRLPPASAHEEPSAAIDKWLFCFTFFFN